MLFRKKHWQKNAFFKVFLIKLCRKKFVMFTYAPRNTTKNKVFFDITF